MRSFSTAFGLKTQLSETDQIKYPASAQLTHKSTAFLQLFEKMYSFSAGLKRNATFLQLFKIYAEKLQKSRLFRSFHTELRLIFARVLGRWLRSYCAHLGVMQFARTPWEHCENAALVLMFCFFYSYMKYTSGVDWCSG